MQDLETKRSKYKGQLMEVKTNKEYTAVLHEIEGVERDIKAREDVILEEMERAESLVSRRQARGGGLQASSRSTRRRRRGTSTLARRRSGPRPQRLASERDEVAASVPEEPLALYARVAKQRGTGVAEARDGMCQSCHVRMRVQIWVEVRKNEQIFQCESCSRVVFYDPPPPTVVVEP